LSKDDAIISFRKITKRFPGVIANDEVSLDFRPGEVHALLGENGAGKSTLIGMLAGHQQPDAGEIYIEGKQLRIESPRHALQMGIGTVYQHRMLVPTLTVAENLLLGGDWWKKPGVVEIRERFEKSCRDFGIAIDIDARTGDLSLGEQQQVEIIRALWRGGKVIVLDEPTAMLTPKGIEELGQMMMRMRSQGIAVVFITHHLNEAFDFGNRISVLRHGRVAGEMTSEEMHGLPRQQALSRVIQMMFGESPKNSTEGNVIRPSFQGDVGPSKRFVVAQLGVRTPQGHALVEDISFDVRPGEIFGIAGVDGNGQTPLAEAIAGQIPSEGAVVLDGKEILGTVATRYRAGIRYATDDRLGEGTVGAMPISLNLLLKEIGRPPFWRRGFVRRKMIDEYAEKLMREFDVRAPSSKTPIGRLSGGNIQKVLLARELSGPAKLIIYNKPTHGLDLRNIEATRQRILDSAAAGLPTILISTDLDEVLALSDRIGVMVRGRMTGIIENGEAARRQVGALMTGLEAA
jgi:general nucleoside transport system ATP-binding protein